MLCMLCTFANMLENLCPHEPKHFCSPFTIQVRADFAHLLLLLCALCSLEVVGIHTSAVRCVPLFLVYLATLMHNYGLATRHASAAAAAAAAAAVTTGPAAAAGALPAATVGATAVGQPGPAGTKELGGPENGQPSRALDLEQGGELASGGGSSGSGEPATAPDLEAWGGGLLPTAGPPPPLGGSGGAAGLAGGSTAGTTDAAGGRAQRGESEDEGVAGRRAEAAASWHSRPPAATNLPVRPLLSWGHWFS